MSNTNIITTIDIWSSKIRTIIWGFNPEKNEKFEVFWIWIAHSTAMKKWNILDMEEFKNNLDKSLEEAEKMAWQQISNIYLSFNSSSFEVTSAKWVIAISWEEVTQEDIDRVLDMARNSVEYPNKSILKVIPEFFSVDIEDSVKNPIGMFARKLEVSAKIFSVNSNILNNIKRSVNDVWIEISDIYPNLLSSPEWVLKRIQKELWVVCIDIWASSTGLTLYEEWVLKHSAIIPLGWDNITNDIALWLRTSTIIAEKLKIEHSVISTTEKEVKEKDIILENLNIWAEWTVCEKYLSQITTARYEEIFKYIRDELIYIWKDWMLPEWAVFVWWSVKTKQFLDSAKENLKLPCFIWAPVVDDNMSNAYINDPVYSAMVWTMILSNRYNTEPEGFKINIWWFFSSIWKIIKKLLP